jgi:hypothetical protein
LGGKKGGQAESVKGQQPQIPANADLLLIEGDTEYYVVIK